MSAVDLPYPEASEPRLLTAVIVNAPASVGAPVFVRIPSYGSQDTWQAVHWEPHGATLPTAGTRCLVAKDENNGVWVISW